MPEPGEVRQVMNRITLAPTTLPNTPPRQRKVDSRHYGITDVLTGRRPLSEFDQVVKDWQNNGGNAIRTELQQSIAAGG